jgi:hypothetical protein
MFVNDMESEAKKKVTKEDLVALFPYPAMEVSKKLGICFRTFQKLYQSKGIEKYRFLILI